MNPGDCIMAAPRSDRTKPPRHISTLPTARVRSVIELSQVLGNFGAFIGAIVVVLTLVFLASQVRHNREATEANTRSMDEGGRSALPASRPIADHNPAVYVVVS